MLKYINENLQVGDHITIESKTEVYQGVITELETASLSLSCEGRIVRFAEDDITGLQYIEDDDICRRLDILVVGQFMDATASVLIHCDMDAGKLLLHLVRLVAYLRHRRVGIGKQETAGLTLVTTAQQTNLELALKQFHQVFRMRGLARAAHSEVAHTDHGDVERLRMQQTAVEHHVPDTYNQTVDP